MVEPDLWGLGQAKDLPGKRPIHRRGRTIRDPKRTGEHHGHAHLLLAAAPGQLPQQADRAEAAVFQCLAQGPLGTSGAVDPAFAGHRYIAEQREGGEIAHDLIDLGMQRTTIEQREVEAEVGTRTPATEGFGKRAEQYRRGGEAMLLGLGQDRSPGVGVDLPLQAFEARLANAGGVNRQWQLRMRRQFRQTLLPEVLRGLQLGLVHGGLQLIVTKRQFQGLQRQPGVTVQGIELCVEAQDAQGIEDQVVQADGQPRVPAVGHGLHIEQRPLAWIEHAMGTVFTQVVEVGVALANFEGRQLLQGQDAGLAALIEHRTEHFVTLDQTLQCVLQARQVEVLDVVFAIEVAAHAAQYQARVTTQPIGLLHLGHWERRMALRQVGHNRVLRFGLGLSMQIGTKVRQHWFGKDLGDPRAPQPLLCKQTHQAGGAQGITAQGKEVVFTANLTTAQQLLPSKRHLRFDVAAGRGQVGLQGGADGRQPVGQYFAIHLAVAGQGQLCAAQDCAGNHVARQTLGQMLGQARWG